MPAPYISVVVPTFRVGGLDVLFEGLARQTFRDFELVLVDALWAQREHLVVARARDYLSQIARAPLFDVTHLLPTPLPATWPACSFCAFANAGIAAARGEVILQFADYTWAPPDLLAKHAAFHKSGKGALGLMGPQQYLAWPPVAAGFPGYRHEDFDRYTRDVAAGHLDLLMWSVFADSARWIADPPSHLPLDPIHAGCDPKLRASPGRLEARFFHAKNESFKRSDALAINGYDLDLDGTNCYQDTDFAERLTHHRGVDWYVDPSAVAYVVNPRHVMPHPRWDRPNETNYDIWQVKKKAGYPQVRGIK